MLRGARVSETTRTAGRSFTSTGIRTKLTRRGCLSLFSGLSVKLMLKENLIAQIVMQHLNRTHFLW